LTIRCPRCGRSHEDGVITCDCGFDFEADRQNRQKAAQAVVRKHRFLSAAVTTFWWLAGLTTIVGLISAFRMLIAESIWWALAVLVATALNVFIYLALATALTLLIELAARQDNMQISLHRMESARK